MEDITIKGVGKKVILKNDYIEINKTIGKNITLLIEDIININFTEGTLNKNGKMDIIAKTREGKNVNENIMYWYTQNRNVSAIVNYVINYPKREVICADLEKNIISEPKIKSEEKKKSPRQIEKERKKVEFERIMASNPEVTVSRTQSAKATEKDRISNMQKEGIPYCPKCHSVSIHYIENRKRLSVGRTIVGGVVGSIVPGVGTAVGAAMGGLTSNKQKKGTIKCLNCGHTWKV